MKLLIDDRKVNRIPILDVFDPSTPPKSTPIIIMIHGFNACKEDQLKEACYFARRGFFVTLFDAYLHGELQNPDFTALPFFEKIREGPRISEETANYIDQIIDQHIKYPIANAHKIGLIGTSMGGRIMYQYLSRQPRPNLKAAVSVISSPKTGETFQKVYQNQPGAAKYSEVFENLRRADLDPYQKLLKLGGFPLLMLNGASDPMIPIDIARQCYAEMAQSYIEPEKIKLIEYPDIEHQFTEAMNAEACRWFQRYLVLNN